MILIMITYIIVILLFVAETQDCFLDLVYGREFKQLLDMFVFQRNPQVAVDVAMEHFRNVHHELVQSVQRLFQSQLQILLDFLCHKDGLFIRHILRYIIRYKHIISYPLLNMKLEIRPITNV